MLENEFLDLKKECITNLYLCAENVAKYVDGDDHKQFELERLHSSLQQYCTLNIQEDVASEAMEKTKAETNDSNIDTFEARYKIHLEELARARPQNNNHQFVSEFNRRYQKALPSVTNAAQDSMTQDADVVINESESQQQYIDPYRMQPIKDPVRNTLCGHYYEKVVIMDLIQGNKRTKCAVAGCGNRNYITSAHLIPDDELRFRLSIPVHSTMVQDDSAMIVD